MFSYRVLCAVLYAVFASAFVAFPASLSSAEEKAEPQILFTNVDVFDGKSDVLAEGMSVLVEGNLIKEVAKGDIEVRYDATVIDGGGRTLMLGLIDMHTHLALYRPVQELEIRWDGFAVGAMASETMSKYLDRGYTTIRDICLGLPGVDRALKAGVIEGPRYYHGGACLSSTSGHADWDQANAPLAVLAMPRHSDSS